MPLVLAVSAMSGAEMMGIAIGTIGAAYAVAAFLKDKQLQIMESDNRFLIKDRQRLMDENLEKDKEIARLRFKTFEAEARERQSELLAASDMVERFREQEHNPSHIDVSEKAH